MLSLPSWLFITIKLEVHVHCIKNIPLLYVQNKQDFTLEAEIFSLSHVTVTLYFLFSECAMEMWGKLILCFTLDLVPIYDCF